MKSILCPTDFKEAGNNGIEYAAQLAQSLSASLTITHVRPSIWPEAIQLKKEERASTESISGMLKRMAEETHATFHIPCHFHLEATSQTIEQAIATMANQYDLLVLGTNGADDYYQLLFGSNAFHVIEKAKCPVIVVPQGYAYSPLRSMVYAYDPDTNPIFLIDQLKKLVNPLGTVVRVLHIAEDKPSTETDRKMTIMKEAIAARTPKSMFWSFDFQYAEDVAWGLDHYMKTHGGNILALSFHHRSLLTKLFTQNVVKQITMTAEYPLFVFWQ